MIVRLKWSPVALWWVVWAVWLTSSMHAISRQQQQVNVQTGGLNKSVLLNTDDAYFEREPVILTTVPNYVINETFNNGPLSSDVGSVNIAENAAVTNDLLSNIDGITVQNIQSVSLISMSSAGAEKDANSSIAVRTRVHLNYTAYIAIKPEMENCTRKLKHTDFAMTNNINSMPAGDKSTKNIKDTETRVPILSSGSFPTTPASNGVSHGFYLSTALKSILTFLQALFPLLKMAYMYPNYAAKVRAILDSILEPQGIGYIFGTTGVFQLIINVLEL